MYPIYKLTHKRKLNVDDSYDTKLLGFYSSEDKARAVMELYKAFEGFRDFPDGFVIDDYEIDKKLRNGASLYFVQYAIDEEADYETVHELGVYCTRGKAQSAMDAFKLAEFYMEGKGNFYIQKYKMDQNYWDGGFFIPEQE